MLLAREFRMLLQHKRHVEPVREEIAPTNLDLSVWTMSTANSPSFIAFALHDFVARGLSGDVARVRGEGDVQAYTPWEIELGATGVR